MFRRWVRVLVLTAVALPLLAGASLAQNRRTVGEAEAEVRAAEQGPGHPARRLTGPLIGLGWAYWRAGREQEAITALQRAVDLLDRVPQPRRTVHGRTLSDLGYMLVQSGRANEAAQSLERALRSSTASPSCRPIPMSPGRPIGRWGGCGSCRAVPRPPPCGGDPRRDRPCVHREIHQRVLRPRLEHVVEEGNAGVDLGGAGAVQVEREDDLRSFVLRSIRLCRGTAGSVFPVIAGLPRVRSVSPPPRRVRPDLPRGTARRRAAPPRPTPPLSTRSR